MMKGLLKARRNYNPSLLAMSGGGYFYAYRTEAATEKEVGVSGIALAVLDDGLEVMGNWRLTLPDPPPDASVEDPRLFEHQGRPWVAFTVARYTGKGLRSRQAYAPLLRAGKGWKLGEVLYPAYGANDGGGMEKNWTFFSAQGQIRCIYDIGFARWTVLGLDGERVTEQWIDDALEWPYGRMSGGTPAIPWNGDLLTLFHSFKDHPTRQRYYSAGALTFEALAPHRPKLVTPQPVMVGREEWGCPDYAPWQPLCVFPGGLVPAGDALLVAYGRNDLDGVIEPLELPAMAPATIRRGSRHEVLLRLTRSVRVRGRHGSPGQLVSVPQGAARMLINSKKAEAA
jgi:predicted GH43/DUF377 family glycosyl hydrolase